MKFSSLVQPQRMKKNNYSQPFQYSEICLLGFGYKSPVIFTLALPLHITIIQTSNTFVFKHSIFLNWFSGFIFIIFSQGGCISEQCQKRSVKNTRRKNKAIYFFDKVPNLSWKRNALVSLCRWWNRSMKIENDNVYDWKPLCDLQ